MPETQGKPPALGGQELTSLQILPGPHAVDLRILQANERTLLAWIRTGLALMAFGFMVARVGIWLHGTQPTPPGGSGSGSWSGGVGSAFIVLGTLSNALATLRYVRVRKAIIAGREILPGNFTVFSLALGLVLLGGILIAYLGVR